MDLRYPIGQFQWPGHADAELRASWIAEIESLPERLLDAVANMEDIDTPYREGGWTVRQVIHHLADSHMNSYIRFKLALTEDHPTIRPYDEAAWAELADGRSAHIGVSMILLQHLHARWVILLRSMDDADYARTFYHPGSGKTVRLDECLGMYAWHGNHHLAHITSLSKRMGWG